MCVGVRLPTIRRAKEELEGEISRILVVGDGVKRRGNVRWGLVGREEEEAPVELDGQCRSSNAGGEAICDMALDY